LLSNDLLPKLNGR